MILVIFAEQFSNPDKHENMKFLVCVSKVPDTTTKINFTDNNTKFDTNGVQWIVNPTDEWYALVKAIELKEQLGGTVTVINVGRAENDQIIRKALAIGADDAVRVDADESEGNYVAAQIAEYAKDKAYDIIFTGPATISFNGSLVGGVVAELLDLPYISYANSLEVDGDAAKVKRDIEGGVESSKVKMPVVVSCDKGMAEQRIPNMRGIMAARSKPLTVVAAAAVESKVNVKQFAPPEPKQPVKFIEPDNVDQLVELLRNEAKVL